MAHQDLVPIKVLIGLQTTNQKVGHAFPRFNEIPGLIRHDGDNNTIDWAAYIDRCGIGWHYDKVCGHAETDAESPESDCWHAVTMVPKDFADKAVELFGAGNLAGNPVQVSIITELEFETFYEQRAHLHDDTEVIDTEVVQGILARKQLEDLGVAPAPSASIVSLRSKCLDPADVTKRGIRKNPIKTWEGYKSERGVTVHADQRKA